jgi:hyperosmotically inducible periplasmic protein
MEALMLRTLFRLILVVVVLVAVGAFFFGYRWAAGPDEAVLERPAATTGIVDEIDRERARETGAKIGESVAVGAEKAERAVSDASLTAKIKSKMALDDSVEALKIDIDTSGSVVTLRGTVDSDAERTRAVQLARDTDGVTSVVDKLKVSGR